MPQPLLLIVTGRAGSGKTTLARRLADDLRLPLLFKDGIKESLYDTLGAPDRAESRRLGIASMSLLRVVAAELIQAGVSLILEANFREPYDGEPLRALIETRRPDVAQIWLSASAETLERRIVTRARSNLRHPGHDDLAILAETRQDFARSGESPLVAPGPVFALDATVFSETAYTAARAFARIALDDAAAAGQPL